MNLADGSKLTILLNHLEAESYARLIIERFPGVRAIVAPDCQRLADHIGDADVLVGFHFPVEHFDRAKNLRWFQSTGSGVDSLLPIRDKAGDLIVTNARGIHGSVIADFVMGGATMLHWNFRGFIEEQTQKQWRPRFVAPLADKTLGVVGLGSIGATIAQRAKSAGMTVVGSKRDISVAVEGVDRLFASDALSDMLPMCDFVVLALPSTSDTAGFIGSAELACMKPDAFLINIARGAVVVEADLIEVLQRGAIAGALLDVFEKEPLPLDSPLWNMPNVIVTPHVSGNSTDYPQRVFAILEENIGRFLSGQPLRNVVNLDRGY